MLIFRQSKREWWDYFVRFTLPTGWSGAWLPGEIVGCFGRNAMTAMVQCYHRQLLSATGWLGCSSCLPVEVALLLRRPPVCRRKSTPPRCSNRESRFRNLLTASERPLCPNILLFHSALIKVNPDEMLKLGEQFS